MEIIEYIFSDSPKYDYSIQMVVDNIVSSDLANRRYTSLSEAKSEALNIADKHELVIQRYISDTKMTAGITTRIFPIVNDNIGYPHHSEYENLELAYRGPLSIEQCLGIAHHLKSQGLNPVVTKFGWGYNVGTVTDNKYPSMLLEVWNAAICASKEPQTLASLVEGMLNGVRNKCPKLHDKLVNQMAELGEDAFCAFIPQFELMEMVLGDCNVMFVPTKTKYLRNARFSDLLKTSHPNEYGFVPL
ncbi:hypothetical protein L1D14_10595 [Vibrio tubiashii]|uniref:hypothetical protein n=1 Tax=Vibrio tubiashii TaxID=29498 RepID=UPI001EFC6270|nr:hypothetical protein [Vibrio tubiashii]MCG9576686.1 hypothetical protein [Vibrio tubiashii]